MLVDELQLKKLAKLAKLEIKEQEVESMLEAINKDLTEVKDILNLNTDGLEELVNPYDIEMIMDDDIVIDGNITDKILANAPDHIYNYFSVPKIIE